MSAMGTWAGRVVLRLRVVPVAVMLLIAGLGVLVPAPQAALAAPQGVASITAGDDHTCAIESGKAYCWGYNGWGQLGDGSANASTDIPVAVDTSGVLAGKTLTQITAGDDYTCALDSTGAAYCWGYNLNYGDLGNGNTVNSSVPVEVDTSGVLAGKTLTQITAGSDTTCVLDSAGAAFCWGNNGAGQLGNGTTTRSLFPVAVDTRGVLAGKTLTQITADDGDICALDSTGAAYCWGSNSDGQLGIGTTDSSSVPMAVDTSGVLAGKVLTQITAGYIHTCAMDAAGAAFCWGYNGNGELGDGNSASESNVPVAVDTAGVLAGRTLTQIAAGDEHTCALGSAGAAYCWGVSFSGQLGDGSLANSGVPVAVDTSGVLAGKTITHITAGFYHSCAVDAAGAAYCWGDNTYGELGNDTTTESDVPVPAGPQAPSSVRAGPGDTTTTVSWSAPASLDGATLTGYTATASPGGEACTTSGQMTCTINGLTNGTTYSIAVVAVTTAGDSGASASVRVTPEPFGEFTGPIVSGYRKTKCVDDNKDSRANDTKIVIWDCNGSPEQNWIIKKDGTIRINGKCMDIYRDRKTNKTPVELWTCTGGANQQWRPRNGTLVNPASRRCLDDPRFDTADGTQLEIFACDGGANQQWKLPGRARAQGRWVHK